MSTYAPQLLVGVGASSTVASEFGVSNAARIALRPGGRTGLALSLDVARAAQTGIGEWHGFASAGWLWAARRGRARGWIGAIAGGGMIAQTTDGQGTRSSGALIAGPVLGGAVDITRSIGIWGEAQVVGVAYRLDADAAASLFPALFLGPSLAF
jgi:hypothetical protein